jgi:hypothetical protein
LLVLRAEDRSIGEIAAALAAAGTPISAQTVWQILDDAGLPRLARRDETRHGPPARLEPVKAATLGGWPDAAQIWCDHAGLLLLFPMMAKLGLHRLVAEAGLPVHLGDHRLAVDRHPAAGQVRAPAPRPSHRLHAPDGSALPYRRDDAPVIDRPSPSSALCQIGSTS